MSISKKDLSDIAKEFAATETEKASDKASIPDIDNQISKKVEQSARVRILYDNANKDKVLPYQSEHRWLNGTTYSNISDQQITDAGNRTSGNIFFPDTWGKSNALLTPSGNGNPRTSSSDNENTAINGSIDDYGLVAIVNLLRNGQSSSMSSSSLTVDYTPGSSTIVVTDIGFTSGKLLYITGGGTSAAVKIMSVNNFSLSIKEIIPPASVIPSGSAVIENIPSFSNSERQNLSSTLYSRVLNQFATKAIASATTWNTSLDNQLDQLKLNLDTPAEIATAKANINGTKTQCSNWLSLANTGISGKFIDSNLTTLTDACTQRSSQITSRISQITTALGSVAQDTQGNYSGSGLYLQRFKSLNFMINGSNGPLFQISGLKTAKTAIESKIMNSVDKLATYSNIVRYGSFAAEPNNSSVKLNGASQFSIGDTVYITANDLPPIESSITNKLGDIVTLNISIPKEYTKAAKSGIIKAL